MLDEKYVLCVSTNNGRTKNLPRRALVPIPDNAKVVLERLADTAATARPSTETLVDVLVRELTWLGGERMTRDDFDLTKVPEHLSITFVIEDDDGRGRRGHRYADDRAVRPDGGVGHQRSSGPDGCVPPVLRVLLGPSRPGKTGRVALVHGRQAGAVEVEGTGADAFCPEIERQEYGHG